MNMNLDSLRIIKSTKVYLCYQLHAKKIMGRSVGKKFLSSVFIFLTGKEKVNQELKCPPINQLKREKMKY